MTRVAIEEIERDASGFWDRVKKGESFTVVQGREPIAEIRPAPPQIRRLRPVGLCKGEFEAPDDFDAPLSADILSRFDLR